MLHESKIPVDAALLLSSYTDHVTCSLLRTSSQPHPLPDLHPQESLQLQPYSSCSSRSCSSSVYHSSSSTSSTMPSESISVRRRHRKPILINIRSSIYYIALVTGMGLLTDICLYPLYTPAIPFRLEELRYDEISSKTGWLSSAYAAGLIVATFPITWLGSKYRSKRNILLGALALMAAGVLLFLLVANYAAMVSARILQGASGAGVWVLGLALGEWSDGTLHHQLDSSIWPFDSRYILMMLILAAAHSRRQLPS